ncbi:ZAN [Symbiodinium pilosum]|uniref:ZAN protein n=1 Tax=Symbiodinium pilosum TaxID=2952 RepID=A0A812LLF0_SYMPI|nr:ZAN [Symbiodinium pilosum]
MSFRRLRKAQALTCAFENEFCKWINDAGEVAWTLLKGGAYEGERYVYTEASGSNKNKQFILESERFVMDSAIKLSFYYHMKGTKMGDLKVLGLGSADAWNELFSVSGSQGDSWLHAEIPIPGWRLRV